MVQIAFKTKFTLNDIRNFGNVFPGTWLFGTLFGARFEAEDSDYSTESTAGNGYEISTDRFYIVNTTGAKKSGCYINDMLQEYWNVQLTFQTSANNASNAFDFGVKANDVSGTRLNSVYVENGYGGAAANTYFNTVDGAASTDTNISATAGDQTTAHVYAIYLYDDGGTKTSKCYVDGTLAATDTAHEPTGNVRPFIAAHSEVGTAAATTGYYSSITYTDGSAP